jgi:hypothetical protein
VLVLVGATIVGSMATVWHGLVNPPRPGTLREWAYQDEDIRLAQGAEMGRFLLGSTVVLLFPRRDGRQVAFNPAWAPGGAVRMGQVMGQSWPVMLRRVMPEGRSPHAAPASPPRAWRWCCCGWCRCCGPPTTSSRAWPTA